MPPFSSATHSDFTSEVTHQTKPDKAVRKVDISEKNDEANNNAPDENRNKETASSTPQLEKERTEMKLATSVQKKANKRDRSNSPRNAEKKKPLESGKGDLSRRSRSVSPRKPDSKHSKEHQKLVVSPNKNDSRRKHRDVRDRSVSPRKSNITNLEVNTRGTVAANDHPKRNRSRSVSPKKPQKTDGSKDKVYTEKDKSNKGHTKSTLDKAENVQHPKDRREKSGNTRPDTGQHNSHRKNEKRSPGTKSRGVEEKAELSDRTCESSKKLNGDEKVKRVSSGDPTSYQTKTQTNSRKRSEKTTEEKRQADEPALSSKEQKNEKVSEATDKTKDDALSKIEGSSGMRKTPITPGPWKVPSASKITETIVNDKRV